MDDGVIYFDVWRSDLSPDQLHEMMAYGALPTKLTRSSRFDLPPQVLCKLALNRCILDDPGRVARVEAHKQRVSKHREIWLVGEGRHRSSHEAGAVKPERGPSFF
jgi:hypothetical protein